MATPIAELKQLFMKFLACDGNFSKVPAEYKKPMLVKVFRAQPFVFIQDKEHYCTGYFSPRAMKKFQQECNFPLTDLVAKTLKIEKFKLEMSYVSDNEYNPVSYMNREIKFIIEDFSLSRYLKKGVDVNRFVVNMCLDDHVKLSIAHFIHYNKWKAGSEATLKDFHKNLKEAKYSYGTDYDAFGSVYYGGNDLPEIRLTPQPRVDSRFKMGELVTWIVDPQYDSKTLSKGKKRRSLKKETKDEAIKDSQDEIKELESIVSSAESDIVASDKSKKSRKPRKTPQSKQSNAKSEQVSKQENKSKKVNGFIKEIEAILQYSKKSKSTPDMDFLTINGSKEKKEVKKIASPKPPKKMNHFREYIEWYDEKCKSAKGSVYSKAPSTNLSTPLKASLRISQRLTSNIGVR